ncbi:MAG: RNase adapter RapZ [Deltaproteobacteria bacterium]|nr:MAG: RNase adapter RapZ [Deltaproteobacteria bacterium]
MAAPLIVSGMSGSGKSTALRALEDAGWYCLDNLPVPLLPRLLEYAGEQAAGDRRLAVAVDARDHQHIAEAAPLLDRLAGRDVPYELLFVDASDETLVRRFKETRRRHPLEVEGNVRDAIGRERALLAPLRAHADHRIETDGLSVHDLKRLVQQRFVGPVDRDLRINLLSFGFRHGLPTEADLVFDVRFLRNPHFVPELRYRTGLDAAVAGHVLGHDNTQAFLAHLLPLLQLLVPLYRDEGKVYLTIAFGCTGGQHRSVAIAERVGRALASEGLAIRVEHRDEPHWSLTPTPET